MSKNDEMVKQLLEKVEEQKKHLGKKPRSVLVTNGLYKSPNGEHFNVNTISDTSRLVYALAELLAGQAYFDEACNQLGCVAKPFKWDGYTVDEWKEDFQLRKDIIEYNTRKAQLDLTQAKLKALMSEDARTADELEKIKEALGV